MMNKLLLTSLFALPIFAFGQSVNITVGTSISDTTEVCNGASINVSATTSGITSITGYSWQISNGSNVTNASGSSFTFSPTSTGLYTINATVYGSDTVSETSYADVTAQLSGVTISSLSNLNSQTLCNGSSAGILNAAIIGGGNSLTYNWEKKTGTGVWNSIGLNSVQLNDNVPLTQTTEYRLIVTNSALGCSTVTSNTLTFSVYSALTSPIVTGAQTICFGTAPQVISRSNASGGDGMYTYSWESSSDNNNWSVIPNNSGSSYQPGILNQSKYFRSVVADGCDTVTSNSIFVEVTAQIDAGTITAADNQVCWGTGSSITLSGTSGGDGSYSRTWEISSDGQSFTTISGQTGTSLSSGNLTDDIYYRVVVTSGCGVSDVSNTLLLDVADEFVVQSITYSGDVTLCYNTSPSILSIAPQGGRTPYTYTWQKKSSTSSNWSNISNSNNSNYTELTGLTENTDYRVVVSSADGCGSITSAVQAIAVRDPLEAPTISTGQTICYDTDATITRGNASGADGNYVYEWQSSTDNVTYSNLSNSLSSLNTGDLTQDTYFRVKVSNTLCGTQAFSSSTLISVRDAISPGTISVQDNQICYNSGTTLTYQGTTGGDGNYSIQWERSNDGNNFANISGATTSTLNTGDLTTDKYYRVNVTSGCGVTVQSSIAYVSVALGYSITPLTYSGSTLICYDTNPTTISVTPAGGRSPYTYTWQKKSTASNTWSNISNVNQGFLNENTGLTTQTDYRVLVTSSDGCGTLTSNVQTIDVRDELTAPSVSAAQTICHNTDATISRGAASGADGNYNYQWQSSTDNISYSSLASSAASINTGNLIQSTYYRVKVSNSLCGTEKFSGSSLVTVRNALDAGSLSIADDQICYSSLTTLSANDVSGADGNYTYQWQYLDNSVGNWTNTGSSNSLSLSTGILNNDRSYRVIVNSGCNVTDISSSAFIDVADEFTIGNIQNSGTDTICYNTKPSTLTISGAGGRTPYSYQWQRKLSSGTVWTNVGTNSAVYTEVINQTESVQYRVVQTSSDGCGSLVSGVYEIIVRPDVVAPLVSNDVIICNNTSINLSRGNSSGANDVFTYEWQKSSDNSSFTSLGQSGSTLPTGDLLSTAWYRVQVSNSLCSVSKNSLAVRVKVRDELAAGGLSTSDNQICHNTNTSLTLSNTGGADTNYTYTWQYNEGNAGWSNFGLNSVSVSTPNHVSDVQYRVVVGSGCGVNDTTSELSVDVADSLIIGNIVNLGLDTICFNTLPSTLSITGSGGRSPYSYQWQRRSLSGGSWSNVGSNSSTFSESTNQLANVQYRVLLSSQDGCGTLTSVPYTIIVRPDLTAPSISTNTVICHNTNTTLTRGNASGANGTFVYQWQRSTDGVNFSPLTQSGQSYNTGNLTSTSWYRVLATNNLCSTSILSNPVRVKVRDTLFAGTISVVDDEICFNTTADLSITGTAGADSSYSYDWQYNENGTGWNSFSTASPNAASPQHKEDVQYRAIVNSGCNVTDISNLLNVTVADSLDAGVISVYEDSVCYGSTPMQMSISGNTGGYSPYSYDWERRISLNGSWNSVSTLSASYQELDSTLEDTYYRVAITSDQGCGTVTTPVQQFRVNALPGDDSWSILGPDEVCSGASGINYQLSSDYNTGTLLWSINNASLSSNSLSKLFADFDDLGQFTNDTLEVILTSNRTGCERTIIKPLTLLEQSSPEVAQIVQKAGTNILICSDTTQGVKYHWGYIPKSSGLVQLVPGATGRYYNFNTSLDTSNNVYFVRTSYGTCHTFSYFGVSSNPLVINENGFDIILYPNPTSEFINIESNISPQRVWLSEASGRMIPLESRNNRVRVPDQLPSGFYVLTLEIDGSLVQKKVIIDRR